MVTHLSSLLQLGAALPSKKRLDFATVPLTSGPWLWITRQAISVYVLPCSSAIMPKATRKFLYGS